LPRYALRADALTDFAGYSNADWTIQTPCLKLGEDFGFSAEFIEETLKYFGNNNEIYTNMCVLLAYALVSESKCTLVFNTMTVRTS